MSKKKRIVAGLLLALSLILAFGGGYAVGSRADVRAEPGLDVTKEAWHIIFADYVDREKLDAGKLGQGAIKGMVEALNDPYSTYLKPETYQLSQSHLRGEFEGIGAYVGVRNKQLVIIAPITNSPAAKAGIRAGDVILEIDGNPATEMSLEEAVLRIRGRRGTAVRLLVLHQGETKPEEIEIVRARIELTSVDSEMREDTAYIRISHFSERTDGEFSAALSRMSRQGATGIILDLRSNPGGLLEVVVDVASHFVKEGVVVNVVDNRGKKSSLSVRPGAITSELPLVVLVDNYSASGSEVLAGALQDHRRATIAGTRTFGKGSVNTLRRLRDGSGLYLTTARWLTPNGHRIEGERIRPDVELKLEGEPAIQWAVRYLKGKER